MTRWGQISLFLVVLSVPDHLQLFYCGNHLVSLLSGLHLRLSPVCLLASLHMQSSMQSTVREARREGVWEEGQGGEGSRAGKEGSEGRRGEGGERRGAQEGEMSGGRGEA